VSLTDAVCRTVRREIRAAGLVNVPSANCPPPCDLDAEGEILSALLDAHATQDELKPLAGRHFYSIPHQQIWEAIAECPPGDVDRICQCLATRGWRGAISDELDWLLLHQPWICLRRLRAHVPRLIELADRRELIERLHTLQIQLSAGDMTAAEARAAV
jgi:replicative DNA helicase